MIHRVVCCCIMFVAVGGQLSAAEPRAIFNGRDLTGWEGNETVWSVEDDAIVGRTTADAPLQNNTFLVWRGGEVGNFRLTLEYRIEGGNSGVQYRSKVIDKDKWIVGGYQADIDSATRYTGILYDERGRGILAERGQRVVIGADGKKTLERFADAAELQKAIHEGDWNQYVIEARGPQLRHTINGKLMSETIDNEEDKRVESGVLALQLHTGPPMVMRFRKIMLEDFER